MKEEERRGRIAEGKKGELKNERNKKIVTKRKRYNGRRGEQMKRNEGKKINRRESDERRNE